MEELEGIVESILFQSDSGDFAVFKINPGNKTTTITVVGNFPAPLIGEHVEIKGNWVEHTKFGQQFKAEVLKRIAPTTEKGIERFLASGAIKGIGPSLATRLVKQFGEKTLEILENNPSRLKEVEGIGDKKAQAIYGSFVSQSELREVMIFLELNGVSGAYGARIYNFYGGRAIEILKENPYRMAQEVDGIGFRTADQIALSIGFDRHNPDRLGAGVHYALGQTGQAGHSCIPKEHLITETAKLLNVDAEEVSEVLSAMMKNGHVAIEEYHGVELIYPFYLYNAEKNVALRLKELLQTATRAKEEEIYLEKLLTWEEEHEVQLAKAQKEAVVKAMTSGVFVLTGGPGTGKTTTVRGILAMLEKEGYKIVLAAPTGRAAKRLSDTANREAMTLHRLLEAGGKDGAPFFGKNETNPIDADCLIVDEVSMMDIILANYLFKAIPEGCRLILVGDVDQLPAVGPGAVLKDILRSKAIPVVRLTEVFRQAGESYIVRNAHLINSGQYPICNTGSDFIFIELNEAEDVAKKIVSLCKTELIAEGYDVLKDIQILSPMHKQVCGVENLNKLLQKALNEEDALKPSLNGINQVFRLGDKVMQMRNNYQKGVFNGDIGYIIALDTEMLLVRYPDVDAVYEKSEIDELHLAYAMSVHKSQGSEYPVVIMPIVAGHYIMLQRNLLYTAVTRAKEKVILLGTKKALNTALSNDKTRRRYSLLAERLRGEEIC